MTVAYRLICPMAGLAPYLVGQSADLCHSHAKFAKSPIKADKVDKADTS